MARGSLTLDSRGPTATRFLTPLVKYSGFQNFCLAAPPSMFTHSTFLTCAFGWVAIFIKDYRLAFHLLPLKICISMILSFLWCFGVPNLIFQNQVWRIWEIPINDFWKSVIFYKYRCSTKGTGQFVKNVIIMIILSSKFKHGRLGIGK